MSRSAPRAFTLLEVLAASAVFALLVLLVAQVLALVSSSVSRGGRRSTTEIEVRSLFARIGSDLRQAVIRRDVDFSAFKHEGYLTPEAFGGVQVPANLQPGNDRMAFFAQTAGLAPGGLAGPQRSSYAVVGYDLASHDGTPRLFRAARGLAWESDDGVESLVYLPATLGLVFPNLFTNPELARTAAENVFRFEISYLLRSRAAGESPFAITPWNANLDGADQWPNGLADVYAIVVTVAALDERSRTIAGDLSAAAALLPDAKDSEDPAPVWRDIVNAPDFAQRANLPPEAAAAVRVYQHAFFLPGP
jgi:prepilin-type N-terminal cleavage/methylation domain-containing protein